MDTCENAVCIVRRCLAEYGLMWNTTIHSRVLPCNLTLWSRMKSDVGCKPCFLLSQDILEKILMCILCLEYLDVNAMQLKPIFYSCLRKCDVEKRIKGTNFDYSEYWNIKYPNEVDTYINCHHSKVKNDRVKIFYPCALWFLLATVLQYMPNDLDKEIVEVLFYLFARCNKQRLLENLSERNKYLIEEYISQARKEADFFHVIHSPIGTELRKIFNDVSHYLYQTNKILEIGLKQQLNMYLLDVNPDKQVDFEAA